MQLPHNNFLVVALSIACKVARNALIVVSGPTEVANYAQQVSQHTVLSPKVVDSGNKDIQLLVQVLFGGVPLMPCRSMLWLLSPQDDWCPIGVVPNKRWW